MMGIMMQLRQMTFPSTGQYVQARLKASSVSMAPAGVYHTVLTDEQWAANVATQKKSRKRRKKRPKKKKKGQSIVNNNDNCNHLAMKESISSVVTEEPILRFTNDHFPSLQEEKVEWETEPVDIRGSEDNEDDDSSEGNSTKNGDDEGPKPAKALSDAASTATTSSSTNTTLSASGFDLAAAGTITGKVDYAAAVLNASNSAPAIQEVTGPVECSSSEGCDLDDGSGRPGTVVSITSSVVTQSWGGGSRSFAEVVLKQEN